MTSAKAPHAHHGPEPVRCTDCGNWRLRGQSCTTCYPPSDRPTMVDRMQAIQAQWEVSEALDL